MCVNTILSEISPFYQNSALRGRNVLDQKNRKMLWTTLAWTKPNIKQGINAKNIRIEILNSLYNKNCEFHIDLCRYQPITLYFVFRWGYTPLVEAHRFHHKVVVSYLVNYLASHIPEELQVIIIHKSRCNCGCCCCCKCCCCGSVCRHWSHDIQLWSPNFNLRLLKATVEYLWRMGLEGWGGWVVSLSSTPLARVSYLLLRLSLLTLCIR